MYFARKDVGKKIFYTNSEVTKFHVHGLFRVTALSILYINRKRPI